jgi:hypothetical protein
VADDFLAKQLPHNVTWGLTMLYSLEHPGNFDDNKSQVTLPPISIPHGSAMKLPSIACYSNLPLSVAASNPNLHEMKRLHLANFCWF